ncbi:MAG TPA: DUF4173 domain-containing protein [Bacteroidia bacterium]|nr:DUF4173 domain-containing protein [Bacteroidia bacterium]
MKIKDILITLGGFLFSYLFYQQEPGINLTVFSIYIIACLAMLYPQAPKNSNWWLAAGALLIASGCMAWYSNALCFFATLFSWVLLSAYTFRHNEAALLNFIQGGFSLVLSVPKFFKGLYLGRLRKSKKEGAMVKNILVYVLITGVLFIFLILYANASSVFGEFLQQIDLSFISFGWLFVAVVGFFIMHGLVKHRRLKAADYYEKKLSAPLAAPTGIFAIITDKLKLENKAGTLLLALLNLLLLMVNISDIVFLSQGQEDFEPGKYHELVHQGVGALIFSIILAVVILLYFFRGKLNFHPGAKNLRTLAYLWMAQNIVLVATAAIKNGIYIQAFDGLTYKRVGVYYFLLLCAIGLVITVVKLYAKKPNWYLVRTNFTAFFIVMIASCLVDWDAIIMKYNFRNALFNNKYGDPDMLYLSQFSPQSILPVAEWVIERTNNPNIAHPYDEHEFARIGQRIKNSYHHLETKYANGWQSFSYKGYNTYRQLSEMPLDSIRGMEYIHYRDSLEAATEWAEAARVADSAWRADSALKADTTQQLINDK